MVSLKKCTFRVIAIVVIIAVIFQFRGAKMSCIFCDIVSKKVNTELLYEDEVNLTLLPLFCQFLNTLSFHWYLELHSIQRH